MDAGKNQAQRDLLSKPKEEDAKAINILATLSIGLLFLAFIIARSAWGSPVKVAALFGLAAMLGALVLVGAIESAIRSHFARFYGFRLASLALFALATYLARIFGLADINAIFHIDPGALPLTVWAATIISMLGLLHTPFLLGLGVSVYLMLDRARDWSGTYTTWDWLRWFASVVAFGLFLFFDFARLGAQERKQLLYRIAQSTDFVETFRCQGIDSTGLTGLFIGPEQRKVLLAPVIEDSEFLLKDVPGLFKPVKIPAEFPIVECIPPSMDIKQWREDHLRRYPFAG